MRPPAQKLTGISFLLLLGHLGQTKHIPALTKPNNQSSPLISCFLTADLDPHPSSSTRLDFSRESRYGGALNRAAPWDLLVHTCVYPIHQYAVWGRDVRMCARACVCARAHMCSSVQVLVTSVHPQRVFAWGGRQLNSPPTLVAMRSAAVVSMVKQGQAAVSAGLLPLPFIATPSRLCTKRPQRMPHRWGRLGPLPVDPAHRLLKRRRGENILNPRRWPLRRRV